MTRVKICGIRNLADGQAALAAGADMLGFVFYPPSKRWLSPEAAASLVRDLRQVRDGWLAVGVFVDQPAQVINQVCQLAELNVAQLCGSETPEACADVRAPVFKVMHVPASGWSPEAFEHATRQYQVKRFLLDTEVRGFFGGTGRSVNWQGLAGLAEHCMLAGGLRPDNVLQALQTLRPWGVDVSTGVERGPGKDPQLIQQFVQQVQAFDRGGH